MSKRIFKILKTQSTAGCLEAGVDEAGRGCLAGPVCCAAVILPEDFQHVLLQDSKKLTEEEREMAYKIIVDNAICYSVELISADVIDKINILEATMLGMNRAIYNLSVKPERVIVDGNRFKWLNSVYKDVDFDYVFPVVETVVSGDATYANIAAASVLAKVTRDRLMTSLSNEYPEYGFAQNKGYGTEDHRTAIKKHGFCDIHRKTFAVK